MNEDQTKLNPVGDDAMEARVVAWVLGQASAFESAELETWCETHPEWRVYQRRMLALHGLLGQAVQSSADATWKLSDQRRAALDGILGTKDVVVEAKNETRKKRWWPQLAKFAALWMVILSVAYTAFLGIFGKVGGKASMSPEVASYSQEMPAQMNAPMAPSVEMGNGDDFGDGWSGKAERQTVAKRMASPMDALVAADGSFSFQKSESADDQLAELSDRDNQVMTKDESGSVPKPSPASAPAAARAIVTATDKWYSKSEGEKSQVINGTGAGYAGGVQNPTGIIDGSVLADTEVDQVTGGVVGGRSGGEGEKDSFAFYGHRRETEDLAKNKPSASKLEVIHKSQYPTEYEPPVALALAPVQSDHRGSNNIIAGKQIDRTAGGVTGEKTAAMVADPIPPNTAITGEETKQVDEVRRKLYVAEGKFNLGQADEAKKEYEQVLRIDPYNKAARHMLEQVAASKRDYYRSAYDHTRAELLMDVDRAWELAMPPSAPGQPNADQLKAVDKFWGYVASGDVADETKGKAVTANGGVLDSKQEELFDLDLRKKNRALEVTPNTPEPDFSAFNVEIFNQGAVSNSSITVLPKPQEASANPKPLPVFDEIATTTEAYSTFSLRVSDASFKLAQAALARGERPAPESVRVEEFYNAFDYGDPVPLAKEPVSCFMEQAAHPLFASRNLVRVSMRTAAAGRSAGQPLHLTLLVDQSGSMVRADRAAVMNAAISELTTLLGPQDQVSIIGFARTPRLIAEKIPGNEGARIRQTLAEIPSDGGTNLEQAMALAQEISQRHMQPGAQNRILLMTDGAANLGNAKPEELAERVKSMRQSGLAFDIAGIGTDGLNDELLLELARHGNGRYYVVNRLTDASDGFAKQLAGAFRPAAENVKVQVHFNPERVSRYRLIGFEKDRLKTEDFRNDAVDAAELAAAEAGQAIYQVELLPEGRGDIGEVSVRFRDTTSAQMVERKWTIAHQASAPAWDRASPSMQLAGLAMFAGEKLKGGAVGEMVTFQDWQAMRANVQQYYRQNPRVAQLMDMIRQIEP